MMHREHRTGKLQVRNTISATFLPEKVSIQKLCSVTILNNKLFEVCHQICVPLCKEKINVNSMILAIWYSINRSMLGCFNIMGLYGSMRLINTFPDCTENFSDCFIVSLPSCYRADSRFAPSQWETSLQSNAGRKPRIRPVLCNMQIHIYVF